MNKLARLCGEIYVLPGHEEGYFGWFPLCSRIWACMEARNVNGNCVCLCYCNFLFPLGGNGKPSPQKSGPEGGTLYAEEIMQAFTSEIGCRGGTPYMLACFRYRGHFFK